MNHIMEQLKWKVEPHEKQFDGRWQDESALKENVKVEHELHYGAVKVEGTDKIKHELEWRGESDEFKEQLDNRVKEEDQDGQAPNTSDHKNNGDDDENWSEDEDNTASSEDNLDQHNFKEVEPNEEEQFDGRWRNEFALKGIVKVEHGQHYGPVKVEGTDKIKHEFKWWDEESDEFKEQLDNRVKEEFEPHEEQFDGRWQDESALKRNVKVEHEPHYGAVKVEEDLKMTQKDELLAQKDEKIALQDARIDELFKSEEEILFGMYR
ncbi:hypothetical protein GPALN_011903 [Globodera pallida]|nr:hypothetical protein GPALN_011903 [Globodera pallida]